MKENEKSRAAATAPWHLALARWFQITRAGQDALYRSAATQNLTWDVILLVAEAQYAEQELNVSDVCVTVNASKSTVLKLIAQLTADKVLVKQRKETDSRTHLLRLDDQFEKRLGIYLDKAAGDWPGG